MSDLQKDKKRKRLRNTTQEQYELYLSYMENDYIFRSNTINPTVEPNYLNKKWEELSVMLNSFGNGPALTVEEWKKRFVDWKYATRAKYRKLFEHGKKTGGGSKSKIEITPTEDRALGIWGKVTVSGVEKVSTYEGIALEDKNEEENNTNSTNNIIVPDITPVEELNDVNTSYDKDDFVVLDIINENIPIESQSQKKQKTRGSRPKPLSVLAENLIQVSECGTSSSKELNEIIKSFCDSYLILEHQRLELEREKFLLEHKKFQFDVSKFEYQKK